MTFAPPGNARSNARTYAVALSEVLGPNVENDMTVMNNEDPALPERLTGAEALAASGCPTPDGCAGAGCHGACLPPAEDRALGMLTVAQARAFASRCMEAERTKWRDLAHRVADQGNRYGLEGLRMQCVVSHAGALVSWNVVTPRKTEDGSIAGPFRSLA